MEASAASDLDAKAWPEGAPAFHALRFAPPTTTDGWGPYKSDQRIAYAVAVAGYDPRDVGGVDAVARVREGFVGGQFGDPQTINDDAWGILALRAAGEPVDTQLAAVAAGIEASRARDGGWSHARAALSSSVDATGMALAAMHAAGMDVRGDEAASAFLDGLRDARAGGYRQLKTSASPNCQSTAWAIHARHLLGAPEEPAALAFLRSLQRPDGAFAATPGGGADAFCTVEAVVVLAGARHPMLGWAPGAVTVAPARALEPTRFALEGDFTAATWRVGDERRDGVILDVAFPRAGAHAWSVHASGPHGQMRASGVVAVESQPPVARAPDELRAFVRAPVRLDVGASHDPDGAVVAARVAWGDGNVTEGRLPEHAYAKPGRYVATLRVRDDAGLWSAPVEFPVEVGNRAPVLRLPEAPLVTDRTRALPPLAHDPDGDDVALLWGDEARAGPLALPLGEHEVALLARDEHGAQTRGALRVRVVNVPPTLEAPELPADARPGVPLRLAARATDADGPAPTIAWRFANATFEGALVELALPEGTHAVEVVATDADGATARHETTLTVASAPRALPPLAVRDLAATLVDGVLLVRFEPPARGVATVSWQSDAGAGSVEARAGVARVPLPEATHARVRVELRDGERVAAAEREAARVAESRADEVAAAEDPASTRRERDAQAWAPPAQRAPVAAPLERASVTPAPTAPEPKETPLPAWLALAALALARRGTRAR